MQKIVKERQAFVRRSISDDEGRAELATEPYKLERIGLKGPDAAGAAEGAGAEVGEGELTIYDNVRRGGEAAWKDLCRGRSEERRVGKEGRARSAGHPRRRSGGRGGRGESRRRQRA